VSEGVVEGGREVLFFVPSSIGSCCFLLLVACLLAWCLSCLVSRVSCLVRERASYLHLFGFEQFGAWIISLVVVRERD